ncbi:MAG: DUF167 domain-containing protein [Coriobacteriia bacterium]|nr:DUF167 domain-containing protein [Coriobacteriia bacterium]
MRIAVHVTPKSSRDEIAGWRGGELSVRVTAAPEGGKANAAVCELLARSLGVPKSTVRVVRGETARHKQVEAVGIETRDITRAFGEAPGKLF